MITSAFRTFATVCFVATIALSAPASAGHGNSLGPGLIGFGIGAVVGSALTPQTFYVAPPPPRPLRPLRPRVLWTATLEPGLVQLLP